MMKYKNYLFDWDGSLADTLSDWFETHKLVLQNNGIKASDREISQEVFGKLDVKQLGITDTEKFMEEIETEITPRMDRAKTNFGVIELLKRISAAGGKVAVVTDSRNKRLSKSVKNNDLEKYVDVVLGRDDVANRKPDPEIINKALRLIGGNPRETVMIGDSWRDVEAARAAGVDSVLYFPNRYIKYYDPEDQLNLGATRVIKDFEEVE